MAMFTELMNTPEFSLTKPRFSMDTFAGRCAYFYSAIDPRMCLQTEKTIGDAKALLAEYKAGTLKRKVSGDELWAARGAIDACVHPATGQVINPLFRFAAFIPVNFFIIPFMVLPSTVASPSRTIFIHWFNQTFNSCVNYSNRASDEQPIGILLQAYAAAVGASLGTALGATYALKKMGTAPSVKSSVVRAVLPFLACGISGSANVSMMRQSEWRGEGIPVTDEDGQIRGYSRAAGKIALMECSVARFLWNMPPMLFPPLLLIPFAASPFAKRHAIALETLLVVAGMILGVAPALAFFPLNETVAPTSLEEQFHGLKRKNGEPVRNLTFYKGL